MIKFLFRLFSPRFCLIFSLIFGFLLQPSLGHAAFGNFNSVLLGDRAAGMGGAFTALTEDPAAAPFYNPATISRMDGTSLSTSASLFNKYETKYGDQGDFSQAPLRINKGTIFSVPAASGIVQSFRNFAFALSIVIPSFENFGGVIDGSGNESSTLNISDENLWVGGSYAFNYDEQQSFGFTFYYTSRNYQRSITDRYISGAETIVVNEEKSFYNNSLIYILGYYKKINPNWSFGFSHRFPSIKVSGKGDYQLSRIGTISGADPLVSEIDLNAETDVPQKTTVGLAFEQKKHRTYTFDFSYYSPNRYMDLDSYGDNIQHKATWNANLGGEWHLKSWLALRAGLFTNNSSHPKISASPSSRTGDQIDMWGFSTTAVLLTTDRTTFSLGGYYAGGKGYAAEEVGGSLQRIEKSVQVFSFLVGTSFRM